MRHPNTIMKSNVGSYDCAIRFVAGCLLMLAGNHYLSWWGLLGMAPILTAIVGYCPLYTIIRLDTTACDQHEHEMAPDDEDVRARVAVRHEAGRAQLRSR